MKIEFRKLPIEATEFEINSNSVKFLGTFSKITSNLAKLDTTLLGNSDVDCCKCGQTINIELDEKINFLISNGIYTKDSRDDEEAIVIEVENHIVDFDEILHSEMESLNSEYYICDSCKKNDNFVEIEY
ncbi:MAG: hypothetical protein U9Q30_03475 [Campylobacterota bacterium]|nr:hypothetical protein [Campylobacterota bacterium]